ITAYLSADDVLIDYGTQYCLQHEAPSSVADFQITEDDFNEFCEMIKNSEFKYDKQTESLLKRLKEMAEFEGYMENASAEFEALEKKLSHNIDFDLQQNKEDIMLLMAREIVKRYFFQSGTVQESIKHDKIIKEAIEVLSDESRYNEILKKQ
ncbi:MAG: peptidase S41, partial [Bacteroidaceae bacterium]|nr:peptidase S41 [Bacteroidaceae bacterium]